MEGIKEERAEKSLFYIYFKRTQYFDNIGQQWLPDKISHTVLTL